MKIVLKNKTELWIKTKRSSRGKKQTKRNRQKSNPDPIDIEYRICVQLSSTVWDAHLICKWTSPDVEALEEGNIQPEVPVLSKHCH